MNYNLESREGSINYGRTRAEDGFIYSDRLRQTGHGEFISRQGSFTTCDLADLAAENLVAGLHGEPMPAEVTLDAPA